TDQPSDSFEQCQLRSYDQRCTCWNPIAYWTILLLPQQNKGELHLCCSTTRDFTDLLQTAFVST
ncbi:hypothetical protein, partial [Citrobacter amalonaticus]|uniref:hypothetical protein n=1 Tax=Citrobacter amalonaticus TaxID=35703 RepID=UPI001E405F77